MVIAKPLMTRDHFKGSSHPTEDRKDVKEKYNVDIVFIRRLYCETLKIMCT